ncbi:MAG: EAL domain-containing protein [Pseudomonadales bacterium]|nr:EAL domain-containing protein [Pseudomonadales bacterium]
MTEKSKDALASLRRNFLLSIWLVTFILIICVGYIIQHPQSASTGTTIILTALVGLLIVLGRHSSTTLHELTQGQTKRDQQQQDLKLLFETTLQQAKQNEEKFKALTEQANDAITVADAEGNYTFVNSTFCQMMGFSEEELLGMTVFDVKAPEQDHASFDRTKGSREGTSVEVFLQRKDGSIFISEVIGKNIIFEGKPQVLGTIRDITDQVRKEEKIRTLSQAIEQSPVSVVITDPQGVIEYVNRAAEKATGYSQDAIIGSHLQKLKPDSIEDHPFDHLWSELKQGKPWEGELLTRKKDGDQFWEYGHFSLVKDEYGKTIHYLAVKEDISLRKTHEEKILQQAHYDSLTGLPNRFLSLDRLQQLINDSSRYGDKAALLFLDLDDFKKVNDTLGHDSGDQLLIEAASRLKTVVRSGDTVGRLGGDEFIVLLGGLKDAADARHVAENLLERFRNAFKINERELLLTTTVGIAIYPQDGTTASELMRNADSAMYHAKDQGRNTYSFFTEDMNREVSHRLALEEQIHGALTRDEFHVRFQPIIDVAADKIIGAEALLRWQNPALGCVPPDEFIPIAEQTGLIIPIGQFVLTEALCKAARWQEQYDKDFRLTINFSPRQFRDPKLVEMVKTAMDEAKVPRTTLELEITEGVLMSGHSYIDDAISALNQLDISIAMDDFGTGYSSLSYLRNYPFDVLKIDRSFIHELSTSADDRELISAIVAMAHGLKLKVVAEGVETKDQLQYLQTLGCDYAQGFLFGEAITAAAMDELLFGKNTSNLYVHPTNRGIAT